ncbi:hypothetical protein K474DRAFT_1188330 [Panus rudis PR-1116 ss-1]|nr:hypothetical protein K474DRAFT_1188330 [Panus rudis PR-1116 ss-1]
MSLCRLMFKRPAICGSRNLWKWPASIWLQFQISAIIGSHGKRIVSSNEELELIRSSKYSPIRADRWGRDG